MHKYAVVITQLKLIVFLSDSRFSANLSYCGLTLNVGSFGLNIYLTQIMFGFVEIPSNLISLVLIQRIGRRLSEAGLLFVGGVTCLLVLSVPKGMLFPAGKVVKGKG